MTEVAPVPRPPCIHVYLYPTRGPRNSGRGWDAVGREHGMRAVFSLDLEEEAGDIRRERERFDQEVQIVKSYNHSAYYAGAMLLRWR